MQVKEEFSLKLCDLYNFNSKWFFSLGFKDKMSLYQQISVNVHLTKFVDGKHQEICMNLSSFFVAESSLQACPY